MVAFAIRIGPMRSSILPARPQGAAAGVLSVERGEPEQGFASRHGNG